MALDDLEAIIDRLQNKVDALSRSLSGGSFGTSATVANKSTSSTTAGNGLFDLGPSTDRSNTNRNAMFGILGGSLQVAGAMSAMLPTAQEAMNLDVLANRLRFYGQGQSTTFGGVSKLQNALANIGTPVGGMDAAVAANMGAGVGLLPGLSNYRVNSNFTGILGGAALASNLTPGMGLQGGMQAMGALNQARNVNMLRMIGVDVRGSNGLMNDLPNVIEQIFKLLEQSAGAGNVTPQAIAVSAMSGNALDSILNQYFGNDANLRQTVLSGLLQMANSGGASLKTSGTRDELIRTGGTSQAVSKLSQRYLSEQNMLQKWTRATNEGFSGANTYISKLYNSLASGTAGGVLSNDLMAAQAAMTGIEAFSGIRGGAGTQLLQGTEGIANSALSMIIPTRAGKALSGFAGSTVGKVGLGIAGVGAAAAAGNWAAQGWDSNISMGAPANYSIPTATGSAPVYTGAITINVTAPAGSDAWDWAKQISTAMQGTARS